MKNLCGTRVYPNIDSGKKDLILQKLRESGATVTGNNPYDVDTHKHGVKLRGTWNADRRELSVQVTAKNFYVPCGEIWKTIDDLIGQLGTLATESARARVADAGCGQRSYPNIDQGKIDRMLEALRKNGATITGDNPWRVDLNQHGIVLGASWNSESKELRVTVEAKNWYVSCRKIWSTIDDLIGNLQLSVARTANLCGQKSYPGFTQQKVDAMIESIRQAGGEVSGNNPYDIDTKKYGIKLRATFNAGAGTLTLEVTGKDWYVPCSRIWAELDKYLNHVGALSADADLS